MCNQQGDAFFFPITFNMCLEAEIYCNSTPGHHTDQDVPYCISCYYCFVPVAIVVDIVCCPLNMYGHYLEYTKDRKEKREKNKEEKIDNNNTK